MEPYSKSVKNKIVILALHHPCLHGFVFISDFNCNFFVLALYVICVKNFHSKNGYCGAIFGTPCISIFFCWFSPQQNTWLAGSSLLSYLLSYLQHQRKESEVQCNQATMIRRGWGGFNSLLKVDIISFVFWNPFPVWIKLKLISITATSSALSPSPGIMASSFVNISFSTIDFLICTYVCCCFTLERNSRLGQVYSQVHRGQCQHRVSSF